MFFTISIQACLFTCRCADNCIHYPNDVEVEVTGEVIFDRDSQEAWIVSRRVSSDALDLGVEWKDLSLYEQCLADEALYVAHEAATRGLTTIVSAGMVSA